MRRRVMFKVMFRRFQEADGRASSPSKAGPIYLQRFKDREKQQPRSGDIASAWTEVSSAAAMMVVTNTHLNVVDWLCEQLNPRLPHTQARRCADRPQSTAQSATSASGVGKRRVWSLWSELSHHQTAMHPRRKTQASNPVALCCRINPQFTRNQVRHLLTMPG